MAAVLIPSYTAPSTANDAMLVLTPSPATSGLPSHLTWQSALWSLLAIALNSMTQSSPAANSLFSDPVSLVRASPIICLADLVVMVMWLFVPMKFSNPRLSFLEAVRCFRKERGLAKKERVSVLTIVFFILGPLPQFVKLNACSGIPWTLTWSWFYLLCYILTTAIIITGGETEQHRAVVQATAKMREQTKGKLQDASYWIYALAYTAHAIFSIWLIKTSLYTHAIRVLFFPWILLIFTLFLSGTALVYGFRLLGQASLWRRLTGLFSVIYGLGNAAYLSYYFVTMLGWDRPPSLDFETWAICFFLVMLAGLIVLSKSAERMGPILGVSARVSHERGSLSVAPYSRVIQFSHQADEVREMEIGQASLELLFALGMLVLALAYYWQRYDPSNTMKPSWVDVFG